MIPPLHLSKVETKAPFSSLCSVLQRKLIQSDAQKLKQEEAHKRERQVREATLRDAKLYIGWTLKAQLVHFATVNRRSSSVASTTSGSAEILSSVDGATDDEVGFALG